MPSRSIGRQDAGRAAHEEGARSAHRVQLGKAWFAAITAAMMPAKRIRMPLIASGVRRRFAVVALIAAMSGAACGGASAQGVINRAEGELDQLWNKVWGHKSAPPPAKQSPAGAAPQAPAVPASPAQTAPPAAPQAAAQSTGQAAPAQKAAAATPPPEIPVVQPKVETVTDYVEVTGTAASTNIVKLIARVEGYLEKIHFADGALVKKDDLLFTIQQDQYKAQLQQAQAQLQHSRRLCVYAKTEVARYTDVYHKHAATATEVDHWVYQKDGCRGRHPQRPRGRSKSRSSIWTTPRSGRLRRSDGQASLRSRQCRRRRRSADGAGRDQPARSDLCERDFERAAGPGHPRQHRPAPALRPPISSRSRSMSGYRTGPTFPTMARSNTSRRSSTPPPAPSRCAAF